MGFIFNLYSVSMLENTYHCFQDKGFLWKLISFISLKGKFRIVLMEWVLIWKTDLESRYSDYPALLALEMQRQLNNFSPSLKVNLTRTRQGPVSMILNINNGNVAWKRISTSPDFSERTEEKCSNKINEESKAFFHINTVHAILHHTAKPWRVFWSHTSARMRFRFYFHAMEHDKRDKGAAGKILERYFSNETPPPSSL